MPAQQENFRVVLTRARVSLGHGRSKVCQSWQLCLAGPGFLLLRCRHLHRAIHPQKRSCKKMWRITSSVLRYSWPLTFPQGEVQMKTVLLIEPDADSARSYADTLQRAGFLSKPCRAMMT